jgi:flagellar protein FlbD
MILVTRLNGEKLVVNANLIELVEMTPDTLLVLATGSRFMVRESVEEIIERVVAFQRRVGYPASASAPPQIDMAEDAS